MSVEVFRGDVPASTSTMLSVLRVTLGAPMHIGDDNGMPVLYLDSDDPAQLRRAQDAIRRLETYNEAASVRELAKKGDN